MTASSLRNRFFSRVFPARKERNQSGARSMRRWKAEVESGSNSTVPPEDSRGQGAFMVGRAVNGRGGGGFTKPF